MARRWLVDRLAQSSDARPSRAHLALVCAAICFLAVGVRLLHWQDSHVEIVSGKFSLSGVFERYRKEALRMIEEGGILFPRQSPDPGNARMLAHPPGYSILLAGIYAISDHPVEVMWFVQIASDSAAAVVVFLLATELLSWGVGLIGAMLVALSPHLAYYSLLLSPDSLAVLPVLLAVYLIVRAWKRPRMINVILAGALIGLSCWLTANVMLLAPLLGLAVFCTFERSKRLKFAAAVVGSTIIVIAPITIRNAIVFHRFIPLSIQAGLSLVEGIGDYDKEGRMGMPRSDREARQKDAEWNGQPDYARSLWNPDGIDRDRTRFDRGLTLIRARPGWFLGVMVHRAGFMLSNNDSRAREWPFNTASVPPITDEPGYGHPLTVIDDKTPLPSEQSPVLVLHGTIIPGMVAVKAGQPVTSISPSEMNQNGTVLSPNARVSIELASQQLQVVGDESQYGDQFTSAPIAVRKNTDYVLALAVRLLQGDMALKLASTDRRTTLAIDSLAASQQENSPNLSGEMTPIQMPFATGNRTEVRVVLSNNDMAPIAPATLLGEARIFEIGPTPNLWTHYPRLVIRRIQRAYTTVRVLILVAAGIVLLLLTRRSRELAMLLVVPAYFLVVQSPLHTEYRYVLAIHYFLFMIAGTTFYFAGAAISQTARRFYYLAARRGAAWL